MCVLFVEAKVSYSLQKKTVLLLRKTKNDFIFAALLRNKKTLDKKR